MYIIWDFFFTYADDISLLYPTYPYWNTKKCYGYVKRMHFDAN